MYTCHHQFGSPRHMVPSVISASRGLVALGLPFMDFGGAIFWAAYLWCGVSDMLDGPLARKMKVASETGAMVDSVADLVFVTAAAIAILPELVIPTWMWIGMGIVALVKISNVVFGAVLFHKVVALHTIANKLVGLMVFLLPIAVNWIPFNCASSVVIAVAMFAAVQEGHLIRTGRTQ